MGGGREFSLYLNRRVFLMGYKFYDETLSRSLNFDSI